MCLLGGYLGGVVPGHWDGRFGLGSESSDEYKNHMPYTETTERNDSARTERSDNRWNRNKNCSIAQNISQKQTLPVQIKQAYEEQMYVNGTVQDDDRSQYDKSSTKNQNNIGTKRLSEEEIDGSLRLHEQKWMIETANKNRESIAINKDVELECRATDNRLLKVLRMLNLTDKYPGRISRDDMYQITKWSLSDDLPNCQDELASYFMHTIARYDYRAREFHILRTGDKESSMFRTHRKYSFRQNINKRMEEKRALDASPMDIVIAVFLCCDDLCKQDLVSHMWSCRLAIPFVIQEQAPPVLPSSFLWPLRNLVMKWETQHDGNICVREGRLVKEFISSVAFIRVGNIGLSKSALINSVISVSEKTHSIFFHRDSPGSTKHRYLVDGLIDISWYFPMPKLEGNIDVHFKDAVMFFNLHGDAYQFQSHFPMLSKCANIITILTAVENLDRCRHVIQYYLDMGNIVFVILTDKVIQDDDAVIDNFLDNLRAADNQMEYLEVADKQRAEFVQQTRSLLIKLVEGKCVCLEKACSSNINVRVDEKNDIFITAKKNALAISTLLRKTTYKDRKTSFLPLQGDPWKNWAAADKERLRTTFKQKNEDLQIYVAERVNIMKRCRAQQLEILKKRDKSSLVDMFLNSVSISKERKLFIRWLKLEIDDLSREDLSQLYETYHTIMQQFIISDSAGKEKIKLRLEYLEKELTLRTFGLEDILREIGQTHEAFYAERFQTLPLKHNLPELAAEILLDGYPLQLFDGSVNAIPIQWVTDVLRNLDNILEKKHKTAVKMKVITSIGIQSSLKSIMLNALFGCQDAVSAGTRGAYCQLIKIEQTCQKELGIDYVLAVYTEGLQAPEHSVSGATASHENEVFTFVIGLGDLTILNVMGANTTYLNTLLPISIHAFLRMEMTTKFKPKCIIVHQHVNEEDKQTLLQQGRILEDYLDKTTKMTCKVEGTNIKSFKDIVEFDVSKDVYYLPALFEGCQPMAPINTRYSDELNLLKRNLVKKMVGTPSNTLSYFINHLQTLWSAIKRDDFVYLFRNTVEIECRRKLEEYWCEANWKLRQPIHNIMSTGNILIKNSENINELERIVRMLQIKVRETIANARLRQREEFSAFISEVGTLFSETMKKWSDSMDKRFDDFSNELYREIKENFREVKRHQRRKLSLTDAKIRYNATLRRNIEQLVQSAKFSEFSAITEAKKLTLFDDHWIVWKSNILEEVAIRPEPIEDDAFDALSSAFPSGTDALKHWIQVKNLSRYDLDDFKFEVLLTKVQNWTAKIGLSPKKQIKDLTKSLLRRVNAKLKSREGFLRPYSHQDIEQVVQDIKNHFQENRKIILLKPNQEVYLAIIVCGHAIKRLQRIHEKCEIQNCLGNLLEKEKMHYLRIFMSLCKNDELVTLLAVHCREILKRGILHRISHTLPDTIEIDLRDKLFIPTTKTVALYGLMINLARDASYKNFELFIQNPLLSITNYICTCIEQYVKQKEKPLQKKFVTTLNAIEDSVWQGLQKSFVTGRSDFKIWIKTFCNETRDFIVLENIDILRELGEDSAFDLRLFFERLSQCLKCALEEIKSEMCSYLHENHELIKNEVMKRILKYIIGCTNCCPFCGAICMVAYTGHTGEHHTTLHRPQGCNGGHYEGTKVLVTSTCPESVSSSELQFVYYKKGVAKSCYYKDYKTVYPDWKITADATGNETSFWNFFFAKYAEQIAANDLSVPVIPLSWKELDCKTEIKKLEEKMKKQSTGENYCEALIVD
ncbi:hypothetical protein CHS0354_027290 [Potamilus streckersoni]|uniref:VLIG-type G domain-containing protein n=1 Tax=Potamilus streckersoni TaxID=2493646 RepID=A0AAE0W9V9_9BIVA|nr:hypothetical protein CHS0354_027290 [Potamilus streckersoni]